MYTKLAITNIKNNRQFYFPYLLTGIITVAMFYIMCALESNPGIQSMPGAKNLGLILRLGIGVIGIFAFWEWKKDILQKFYQQKHFLQQ